MSEPVRSAGSMSGVNCRRWKSPSRPCASALMARVLARPGGPSTSRWPSASRATSKRSTRLSWPSILSLRLVRRPLRAASAGGVTEAVAASTASFRSGVLLSCLIEKRGMATKFPNACPATRRQVDAICPIMLGEPGRPVDPLEGRTMKILIIAAVVAVLVGVGWFCNEGPPPQNELTLHGNVDIRQVELAFNASGRIAQILAQEGTRVKAGQLLASLDTERLRLSRQQAEAQVAVQRQGVARYLAGSRPEEIRQARAQRDAAKVAVADAEAYYQRQADLVARKFISQQQADSARFALDKARDQLKAAEDTLRLAELGPRKKDIAAAKATLAANEATVAVLQRNQDKDKQHAPTDGVIQNRILEPGDMASPQKPVFTLALTDPVWVR